MPPAMRDPMWPGDPPELPLDDSALRLDGELDCISMSDWPKEDDNDAAEASE